MSTIDCLSVAIDGVEYRTIAFDTPGPALPEMTDAQRDIVAKVLRGLTTAEIAASRGSAVRTVYNQLRAIYRELDVSSRYELIAKIADVGL